MIFPPLQGLIKRGFFLFYEQILFLFILISNTLSDVFRIFDLVQAEYAIRENLETYYSNSTPYSCKLVCGDGGAFYSSKVCHSNAKYKRTVWQCNDKLKNKVKCSTPHLYESEIQESFVKTLSLLLANKEKLLGHCRELRDAVCLDLIVLLRYVLLAI